MKAIAAVLQPRRPLAACRGSAETTRSGADRFVRGESSSWSLPLVAVLGEAPTPAGPWDVQHGAECAPVLTASL